MKIKKRIFSIVLALMLLLSGVIIIYADEFVIEGYELFNNFIVIEENIGEDELMPMASTSCYMTESDAMNYAIAFLGPNYYVDAATGYSRADITDGFKQVRFDLGDSSPHINCETFKLQPNGDYKRIRNEHIFILY